MTIPAMVQDGMLAAIRGVVKARLTEMPDWGKLLMDQLTHAHPTPNLDHAEQPARSVVLETSKHPIAAFPMHHAALCTHPK